MAKLHRVKFEDGRQGHMFWCPGCQCGHYFDDRWKFDNDTDKPTVIPSILTERPRCHLHLRAGKIIYLADSGHHLAGQIVELEEF